MITFSSSFPCPFCGRCSVPFGSFGRTPSRWRRSHRTQAQPPSPSPSVLLRRVKASSERHGSRVGSPVFSRFRKWGERKMRLHYFSFGENTEPSRQFDVSTSCLYAVRCSLPFCCVPCSSALGGLGTSLTTRNVRTPETRASGGLAPLV